MTGWSEELHEIHRSIADRVLFRSPEINARDPDEIISTHKSKRPAPARTVRVRQCCNTPKSEGHTERCYNNPKNWKRR